MRKKTVIITALAFAMCILFAGCSRLQANIKVTDKAKLKISVDRLVSKDYFSPDSDKELTEKQIYKKLKKELKKDYKKSKNSLKFKKIKKKIKGVQYFGYTITGIKAKEFEGLKCYKKNGRIYLEFDTSSSGNPSSEEDLSPEEMKDMLTLMQMGGMSYKLVITFPHKPKTTYGKVKGKTVTIDAIKYVKKYIDKDDYKKIVISSKA